MVPVRFSLLGDLAGHIHERAAQDLASRCSVSFSKSARLTIELVRTPAPASYIITRANVLADCPVFPSHPSSEFKGLLQMQRDFKHASHATFACRSVLQTRI